MFEIPTQEQIDDIIRQAHHERARAMRNGLRWIGRQVSAPFRLAAPNAVQRRG